MTTATTCIRIQRALAVLGTVAATATCWTLNVPLGGAELTVRTNGTTSVVGLGAVLVTALLAGLAGWALLALLERFVRRPARVWTVIALTVLVLSLAGPLGSGVGATTKIALVGLHLTVGLVLVPNLWLSTRPLRVRRSAPAGA
jgi:hypothetical protein